MGKNNLRKAWIDQSLDDELNKLASRMQLELGEGKKTTASRLLAHSIQKMGLVDSIQFATVPKRKKVTKFFELEDNEKWGWKI